MCSSYTRAADEAINKTIEKLLSQVGRLMSDDDSIIEQVAKLRASMNPTIVQKS